MRRKRWPKGTWMQLIDRNILKLHMEHKGFSAGKLARYAGCSRGMIFHLTSGRKNSCSSALAERIAEALDQPLRSLFVVNVSSVPRQHSPRRETPVTNGIPA